jgi:hypothetical protein
MRGTLDESLDSTRLSTLTVSHRLFEVYGNDNVRLWRVDGEVEVVETTDKFRFVLALIDDESIVHSDRAPTWT